jgi:hypothetical protein
VIRVVLVIPEDRPDAGPVVREVNWPQVPRIGETVYVNASSFSGGPRLRTLRVEKVEWFEDIAVRDSPIGVYGAGTGAVHVMLHLVDPTPTPIPTAAAPEPTSTTPFRPKTPAMHACPACGIPMLGGFETTLCPDCDPDA